MRQDSVSVERKSRGYVYLLSGGGYYKIGQTRDIRSRSRALGMQLPFEVDLVHVIETNEPLVLERRLHEEFNHKRVRGEWFELSAEDVKYIKSIGSIWEERS